MPSHGTPTITDMQVIPVAGRDSMLLNIGGAHSPYFTRNLIILEDSAGNLGVGEAPGGETIQRSLEQARPLVVGQPIGKLRSMVASLHSAGRSADFEEACQRGGQTPHCLEKALSWHQAAREHGSMRSVADAQVREMADA